MYEIRFNGKQKKSFKKLFNKLSDQLKSKFRNTLENNPYPSSSHGSTLCNVEKKINLYCIEITGGDRILYDIIKIDDGRKAVLIYYAGDHDGEIRFLKKKHTKR